MRRILPGVAAVLAVVMLPLLLGGLASALISSGALPNRIFIGSFVVDLAGILFLLGGLGSLLALMAAGARSVVRRVAARATRTERQIVQADRTRFLQRLDHELKNPLTVIRLAILNLQESPNLTGEQLASLNRVEQHTQRLQKLVTDLRALNELEARGLEKRPLALAEIAGEAVEASSAEYPARTISLDVQQVPWPVGPVSGDRDLLGAAVRNLLDNALKFTPEDGRIEIRITDNGRAATVEIADNGAGIAESELAHVFDELYRGQNARQVAGSGLGLALVEKIAALHGGSVTLSSRQGHGTIARLQLPLASDGGM